MKKRILKWSIVLLALAIVVFGMICLWRWGQGFYRTITFYSADRSAAEERVMAYAREHGVFYGSYPEALIDLLEKHPEAEQFVLEYPARKGTAEPVDLSGCSTEDGVPLFLQWDPRWGYLQYGSDVVGLTGCGPVCLSMAAFYVTGDPQMSPDRMVKFALEEGYCVPGNGSAWTLISQGGPKLGLQVEELPLDEGCIKNALAQDKPVICVMGPGVFTSSGHYIVLTGVEGGRFRVNDPNSPQNSQRTWEYEEFSDQIRNLWSVECDKDCP